MRIELREIQIRDDLFGAGDHLGREVNADAVRGLQVRKQISHSAADLEDALVGVDKVAINFSQTAVIPSPIPRQWSRFCAMEFQFAMRVCLVNNTCFIKEGDVFHSGLILPEY